MKRLRGLWPFALIALAVLVWNYPVYAVSGSIESASGGKVRVLSSHGSVWAGTFDWVAMQAGWELK